MVQSATEAKLFKVRMLNDDFTPAEFVVTVLTQIFGKSPEDANRLMIETHRQGRQTIVLLPQAEAEAIAEAAEDLARLNKHPLKLVVEPG